MPIPTDLVLDLQRRLGYAPPEQILSTALREAFPGRIAVVSSFGAESAVLLHLVATIDPTTPVLFVDTGRHFPETLAYRDQLATHLGLGAPRSAPVPAPLPARHRARPGRPRLRAEPAGHRPARLRGARPPAGAGVLPGARRELLRARRRDRGLARGGQRDRRARLLGVSRAVPARGRSGARRGARAGAPRFPRAALVRLGARGPPLRGHGAHVRPPDTARAAARRPLALRARPDRSHRRRRGRDADPRLEDRARAASHRCAGGAHARARRAARGLCPRGRAPRRRVGVAVTRGGGLCLYQPRGGRAELARRLSLDAGARRVLEGGDAVLRRFAALKQGADEE